MSESKTLRELDIKQTYSSQADDLVKDFYNPILELASTYNRVTGFFSPKVFAAAARGFAHLVKNGGKIKLVTSVEVSPEVFRALQDSEFSRDDLEKYTKWDVSRVEDELERNYLAVFAHLLASGQLEMRIAITEYQSGILHQKVGIVTDREGNSISFSGSNNETVFGWKQNIEEFKVFKKWELYSCEWYEDDLSIFLSLWNSSAPGVRTIPLSIAAKEKILKETESPEDIDKVLGNIAHAEKQLSKPEGNDARKRNLFDYQEDAINFWFSHNCTGILEMATGTGKTFTTIQALNRLKHEKGSLRAIIAVPLASLVTQWQNELINNTDDCLVITTTTPGWRNTIKRLAQLNKSVSVKSPSFILVTTYNLFHRKDFKELISNFTQLLLVADEMHNLVTENGIRSAASPIFNYRLGLSATPSRLWKPQASAQVMAIFGDNKFTFSIEQAIKRGFLVPFNYYPEIIKLSDAEFEDYLDLSYRIRRKMGLLRGENMEDSDDEQLKNLLIRRARIKKEAEAKVDCLSEILLDLRRAGHLHHALIYVDNEEYLTKLQLMLKDNHIKSSKIVGSTPRDVREQIIQDLESRQIDAIVAIKCLDEGIDIPSAQKAFILSNNTDPREYVQRLGRVLRVDRKNFSKKFADIYDFIVVPPVMYFRDEKDRDIARSLVRGELTRSKFFTEVAQNGDGADFELFELAERYGFVFKPEELCYNGVEG